MIVYSVVLHKCLPHVFIVVCERNLTVFKCLNEITYTLLRILTMALPIQQIMYAISQLK